jgi:acyl transferase domain-containing protein/acyl carrier protein
LGAVVEDPLGEGLVITGALSLESHSWLRDHAVGGNVLLPGTAFVELALRAAKKVGAERISELTLLAPLILPETGGVAVQVKLTKPGEGQDKHEIAIHSRLQGRDGEDADLEWTLHATGAIEPTPSPAPPAPMPSWPPEGAEPIDTEDLYGRFSDLGLDYGPAFQGLTAAWRKGAEVYGEVSLAPEQREGAGSFSIHPALLDAALHAVALNALDADQRGALRLPFGWADVNLHAEGAAELRVKAAIDEEGAISLSVFDSSGSAVAEVGSLLTREVSAQQLQGAQRRDGLLELSWSEVEPSDATGGMCRPLSEQLLAGLEGDDKAPDTLTFTPGAADGPPSQVARQATQDTLQAIQGFLAAEHLGSSRLAVITHSAVAVDDEESPDLSTAPIWGLLRSAQFEHPGRFVLIDTDGSEPSNASLPAAIEQTTEPQLALREGRVLAPRVTRVPMTPPEAEGDEAAFSLAATKTVLITGGTGALGAHVARHLVEAHGARRLLLSSRSGLAAAGAEELRSELRELGAEVDVVACDASDPKAVEGLLAEVPDAHPLGAVVHAAGALDDGTIDSLDAAKLEHVFAPKADGAWNLHQATAGLELSEFVVFSSVAGTLGSPGQANYAAANVFCDALARQRRAAGLPATSIAWGAWLQQSGLTSKLGDADVARMRRAGIEPLSDEKALELFDAALATDRSLTLAMAFNRPALRSLAQSGLLPPILSGLVPAESRRSASPDAFARKLAALPEEDRDDYVLELVCSEIATVLGHASAAAIDPARAFQDIGFDSLAAVELRNRLNAATGANLPMTAVFDYPNPSKLADHVLSQVQLPGEGGVETDGSPLDDELDRLGAMLIAIESDEKRDRAAARLRELLGSLKATDERDLAEATDEEIFEALESELGQL